MARAERLRLDQRARPSCDPTPPPRSNPADGRHPRPRAAPLQLGPDTAGQIRPGASGRYMLPPVPVSAVAAVGSHEGLDETTDNLEGDMWTIDGEHAGNTTQDEVQITFSESDGSDGYTIGTWAYLVRVGRHTYCDGGYPSRDCARQAATARIGRLRTSR